MPAQSPFWSRQDRVAKHTCTKKREQSLLHALNKSKREEGQWLGVVQLVAVTLIRLAPARANFDYSPPGTRQMETDAHNQQISCLLCAAWSPPTPFPLSFTHFPHGLHMCVCVKSSIKAKLPSVLCVSWRYKHTLIPPLPSRCVASYNQIYAYLRQIFQHSLCCCCCCRITHYVRNYNDHVHY